MSKAKIEVEAAPNSGEFVEDPSVSLTDDLSTEALPSLADFADEVGGALPRGWYPAEVIEGYATRKGNQFVTEDIPSKDGSSRNLRLAITVTPPKGNARNLFYSTNYRLSDFSTERLAYIKQLREEMKGVKQWPDRDAQRTSLAIASLGQLEKAFGTPFKRTPTGLMVTPLVGKKVDVRLNINEDQYNDITAFAPLGTITATPRK